MLEEMLKVGGIKYAVAPDGAVTIPLGEGIGWALRVTSGTGQGWRIALLDESGQEVAAAPHPTLGDLIDHILSQKVQRDPQQTPTPQLGNAQESSQPHQPLAAAADFPSAVKPDRPQARTSPAAGQSPEVRHARNETHRHTRGPSA